MTDRKDKKAWAAYMRSWLAGLSPERKAAHLEKQRERNRKRRERLVAINPGGVRKREAERQKEWRRSMSDEQREKHLVKRRERFATTGIEEQRKRRAADPDHFAELARLARKKEPERFRQVQREYRKKLKIAAMEAYGNACACCGEDEMEFLTIDHIKPIRQSKRYAGAPFYYWLREQGYPKGFQVLCFNCNCAKRTADECPHKRIYLRKFKLLTGLETAKGVS